MQTLDVRAQDLAPPEGLKSGLSGKTGAETARNGSSFLAIIDKMLAGAMEGSRNGNMPRAAKSAERGAGDGPTDPGDENTLIKPGALGQKKATGATKEAGALRDAQNAANQKAGAKSPISQSGGKTVAKGEEIQEAERRKASLALDRQTPGARALADSKGEALEGLGKDERRDSDGKGRGKSAIDPNVASFIVPVGVERQRAIAESQSVSLAKKGDQAKETEEIGSSRPKTDRKEKKAFINVHDLRADTAQRDAASPLVKTTEINSDHTADMTIGFRTVDGSHSEAGENSRAIERHEEDGKSFASMLSQELKNNAADFVKTGQIILKDNNAGLIRLTLHPENLGNVKISLDLSGDNRISGKIEVNSKEAYEAFSESMGGLSDAFVQGGFESAGFDLSWSGGGSGSEREDPSAKIASPFYASSVPDVMSASVSSDTVTDGYRSSGALAINVFA
jgi:hypothetical protein